MPNISSESRKSCCDIFFSNFVNTRRRTCIHQNLKELYTLFTVIYVNLEDDRQVPSRNGAPITENSAVVFFFFF